MPDRRILRLAEHATAFVVAMVAFASTWQWLRIGDFPPIVPAAGVALAWGLLRGGGLWVTLAAGAFAGTWSVAPGSAEAVATAASAALSLLATGALARFGVRLDPALGRLRDVVALPLTAIAGGVLGASLAVPLAPAAALAQAGGPLLWWSNQWLPFTVGVVLCAPPVLALARVPGPYVRRGSGRLFAIVTLLVLAVSVALFFAPGPIGFRFQILALVVFPMLAWVTLRAHPGIATSLGAVVMLLATLGGAQGRGLYGMIRPLASARSLESVAGALGFFTLLLAANEHGRRRALQEANERAARLRRVLEGSNDGFWEWNAETDVVEVSERLARMLGYEPHEFIRFPHEYSQLTHPDDEASSVEAVRGHFAGLTGHYETEYRMRHRDGHWVWVLDRGRVTERGPDGAPRRASGTMTDVTERKQAELALRASQEMFDNFMRHSPAIAFVRDRQGRLLWTNAAFQKFVWGEETPDYRGHTLQDLFPPEVVAHLTETDDQVVASNRPVVVEQRVARPGRDAWWLTVKFPIRRPDGEPLLCGMAVEITERRRMAEEKRELEARMMEAQKLEGLGLLAGGIAHDFNNILTGILGYADLARVQAPAGSPVHESLAHIVAGARSAAELTQQMLAYAGRGHVAMRPLVMSALVAEMGHLLHVSIPKRVALRYDFAPQLPALEGDEAQLRQVVMNLIVNAAEAMGDQAGAIVVRVRAAACDAEALRSRWGADDAQPGPYVVLEVTDDGCGMTPETLARIFDPFFSTKFTGRGLGLAAVLGIVRAHHGVVQVESEPGRGTTFRVLLPALAPAPAAARPTPDDAEWRASGTALVIDDEPGVRSIACAMLARIGFEHVLSAASGTEGLAMFREHADEIRLVLLDVTMPDLDGHQVLRALLALRPHTRVVLSSGYGAAATDPAGPAPAAFVAKPYRVTELARAVRVALEAAPAAS